MNVQIGQEVVVGRAGSWKYHYSFGYKVTRITPKGQIVVVRETLNGDGSPSVREMRFNVNGDEIGSTRYTTHRLHLNVDEIKDRLAKEDRTQAACKAIYDVKVEVSNRWLSKETLETYITELEEKLAEAKAAVEAI